MTTDSALEPATGVVGRLLTRTGILAMAGVLGVAGVAAAAAGAPIPVLETAFADDEPVLVDVEEKDGEDEGTESEEGEEVEGTEAKESEAPDDAAAETSEVEGSEADDADSHGALVSAAAQSDCGKKDKSGDDGEDEGAEGTDEVAVTDEESVESICGDGEYRNHGEYVSSIAHEKRDAKAAERAERKADKVKGGDGKAKGHSNGKGKSGK